MKTLGNVFILGDSYSTYYKYIDDTYESYYGEWTPTVETVDKTWWKMLLDETDSALAKNESYSGTTICYTWYGQVYNPTTSFVGRMESYVEKNGTDGIDTVIILGGTNDSWAESPVGDVQYEAWSDDDMRKCLPAFCYLLNYIKEKLPNAYILNVVNCGLKDEITNGMDEACRHYDVDCLMLHDIQKMEDGHPDGTGMVQIKNQILDFIKDR